MATIQIKSTHPESQGDFVIIEDGDFNEEIHELYKPEGDGPTRDEMKAFLVEKGVEFPANIKADKLAELYLSAQEPAE